MAKIRLTVPGKIIVGLLAVAVLWSIFEARQDDSEIDRLASWKPCEIAAEYAEWRVRFEDRVYATASTEIAGGDAEEFVERSQFFYRVATRSLLSSHSSTTLLELQELTGIDARPDVYELAPIEAFVAAFSNECPAEALAFTIRHNETSREN